MQNNEYKEVGYITKAEVSPEESGKSPLGMSSINNILTYCHMNFQYENEKHWQFSNKDQFLIAHINRAKKNPQSNAILKIILSGNDINDKQVRICHMKVKIHCNFLAKHRKCNAYYSTLYLVYGEYDLRTNYINSYIWWSNEWTIPIKRTARLT